jgi:hypothetical protein
VPAIPPSLFDGPELIKRVAFIIQPSVGSASNLLPRIAFAVPDTQAQHSVMDSNLANQLGITGTQSSNAQTISFDGHTQAQVLSNPILITALFLQTDIRPIQFSHQFILVDLAQGADGASFLIGTELLKRLFPSGIPTMYYCPPAENLPSPTILGCSCSDPMNEDCPTAPIPSLPPDKTTDQKTKRALESEKNYLSSSLVSIRQVTVLPISEGEGAKIAADKSEKTAKELADLAALDAELNGMTGQVPLSEQPERLTVINDINYDGTDQTVEREKAMHKLKDALERNAKITGFCNVPEAVCHLELDESKLTKPARRQYPIPEVLKPFVTRQVQLWLDNGRIKPAPPGCRFNTPIMAAPKKDDQGQYSAVRVCLDFRFTNLSLRFRDMHDIPLITDVLSRLAGCVLFGEFDLSDAYMQFPLAEDSQQYSAFTWEGQQYVFTGCIYGIAAIPNFFQRIMNRIFSDLPFVKPYLDNLPFGSHNWDEHIEHALLIIERLNQCNLKLKEKAMKIGYTAMRCLGHLVTRQGIALDPEKQKELQDIPMPSTGKAMRSFLGTAGYLRSHVRHYAEIAGPLEAVKNQDTFDVTDLLQNHFKLLKHAIATAPILKFPVPGKPFRLATDASRTGIGGVLYQPDVEGGPMSPHNIIEIFSKTSNAETVRFSAYKKELSAIVGCLRRFHPLIWGRPGLVIETDHRPLTYMYSSEKLSPALQQWLDVLLDYDFKIEHRPGILNILPDALSRLYEEAYKDSVWGVEKNKPLPFLALSPNFEKYSAYDSILSSLAHDDAEAATIVEQIHSSLMHKAAQTKKVAALIQAVRTRQQSRLASAATASSSSSPAPSPASQAWSEDINMVDADSSSDHTAATSSSSHPSSMDSDSTANINDGMIPTTEDRVKLIIELEKRGKRAPSFH